MKRKQAGKSTSVQNVMFTSLKFMIFFLIVFQTSNVFGQKYKRKEKYYLGGGMDNVSSGNSHGSFLSPYLVIKKGRKSYNVGALVQNREMQLKGGKFSLSYNLTGAKKYEQEEDELEEESYVSKPKRQILQLNAFGFSQYVHNGLLSNAACWSEQKASLQTETDWHKLKLSTAEAGIGFELYVKFTKRVSWKNYAAGSVYYHVTYIDGMYNERYGPSLVLGTGIVICPF